MLPKLFQGVVLPVVFASFCVGNKHTTPKKNNTFPRCPTRILEDAYHPKKTWQWTIHHDWRCISSWILGDFPAIAMLGCSKIATNSRYIYTHTMHGCYKNRWLNHHSQQKRQLSRDSPFSPQKHGWESSRNAGRQVQRHKARAEAAEKERDLHAEVGWGGSGKWQVAWFVNTNSGGVGKPPTGGKRVARICFEVYHCQLISGFLSFLPTWQL